MARSQGGSVRGDKRARFAAAGRRKRRVPPGLWIGGLLLLGVVGLLWMAWPRDRPIAATATAAGGAGSSGGDLGRGMPLAATLGHAPYPEVVAEDGVVRLPTVGLADGLVRYYTYRFDTQAVEFFVVQDRSGQIRLAFNACDVCFQARKGYHQEGAVMVCNNCGRRFPLEQIGLVVGGCNPSPLRFQVEGDTLLVRVEDLASGAGLFAL